MGRQSVIPLRCVLRQTASQCTGTWAFYGQVVVLAALLCSEGMAGNISIFTLTV